MQRYFLELFFKGTRYSGWQIQKNAVAVQQKINEALGLLINGSALKPIETTGCGRTDTGVHATQFFAHFDTPEIEDH
ncbi:MAG TPA: tRNA pseudouridine(38-40) synthase TruA, partial [Bacteroidia bacterium]|nr:tRNA pseudouridine(38-40) synthase TruA [Bacteroidia bacterium]